MSISGVSARCGALASSSSPGGCVFVACSKGVSSSHAGQRSRPIFVSLKPTAVRYGVYTGQGQRWRISCDATSRGRDSENPAERMAEEARRKASDAAKSFSSKVEEVLNNAKRKAGEFNEKSDLRGKMIRAAQAANRKLEELAFDFRRNLAKWDREYRISEKMQEAREFAVEQIENADRQLGARQKARDFTSDFRLKWPTYRRQVSNFLDSPIGRSAATLCLVWLIFSGWLFRILLLSMWILPFAAPLLLSTLSKAAVVEGTCPNCGQRYVGGRNQSVTCSRCRGVVWQPRQDFSKDSADPRIIDIDIEPK